MNIIWIILFVTNQINRQSMNLLRLKFEFMCKNYASFVDVYGATIKWQIALRALNKGEKINDDVNSFFNGSFITREHRHFQHLDKHNSNMRINYVRRSTIIFSGFSHHLVGVCLECNFLFVPFSLLQDLRLSSTLWSSQRIWYVMALSESRLQKPEKKRNWCSFAENARGGHYMLCLNCLAKISISQIVF